MALLKGKQLQSALALTDSGGQLLTIGAIAAGQVLQRVGTAIIGVAATFPPSGAAGGSLAGTYPNPDVAALDETSGPTKLTIGAIAIGQVLQRVGGAIVGVAASFPPSGAAGGDLGATYPNPTVLALEETSGPTRLVLGAIASAQVLIRVAGTVVGSGWVSIDRANKNMVASVTVADGNVACATAVARTPAGTTTNGGYIGVRVNGLAQIVGDGTKVSVDCYFSGDGGTTARALKSVVAGDLLYWNQSIAGFNLDANDRIDFDIPVAA